MKYSINLARRSYLNKRALYFGYALCGVIIGAGIFFNTAHYLKLKTQISTIEGRLTELQDKILANQGADGGGFSAARFEQVRDEIRMANDILRRDAFRWTELLDRLETVVPGDVSIERIEPEHKDGSIKLRGLAKDLRDMNRFLDNLIRSGHYRNVLLLSQSLEENRGATSLIKFSVELQGAF